MRALLHYFAIYGAGEAIARATVLISLPILTRFLTPADYGLLSLVGVIVGWFTVVLGFGNESTYTRFFFDHAESHEQATTTSTWLAGILALSLTGLVIFSVVIESVSRQLLGDENYWPILALAVATAPILMANGLCGQVLRNQLRAKIFILLHILTAIIGLIVTLICVAWLELGVWGIIFSGFITALVFLPPRLWSVRDMLVRQFSWDRFRRMLRYGIGLMAAGLVFVLMTTVDRWMIAELASVDQVGYYAVAATFSSILLLCLSAFAQAWFPQFLSLYRDKPDDAPGFASRVLTLVVYMFGLLAVALASGADILVDLLTGPSFGQAADAIGPLALGIVFAATAQITSIGITVTRRSSLLIVSMAIGTVVNIAFNLVLIPIAGFVGAAWATVLSYIALNIAYTAFTQRLWFVPMEIGRVVLLGALTAAFIVALALLPKQQMPVTLAIAALSSMVFALAGGAIAGIELRQIISFITSQFSQQPTTESAARSDD